MATRRRWIRIAAIILVAILLLFLSASILLELASAEATPFSFQIESQLNADYSEDEERGLLAAFRLSIIRDALVDLGLSAGEAEDTSDQMIASLDDPVPTATALDYTGKAPLTATSTRTKVPTHTNSPSPEPTQTDTPRPSRTPTRTKVPTDTRPPATSPPSSTPGPSPTPSFTVVVDNQDPQICCAVFDVSPGTSPPGPDLDQCTLQVTDLHVFDPAFSAGIDDADVHFKYYDQSSNWVVTSLSKFSGGFVGAPGSDWDAHYQGTITLHNVYDGYSMQVQLRVHDRSSSTSWVYTSSYYYELDRDCP